MTIFFWFLQSGHRCLLLFHIWSNAEYWFSHLVSCQISDPLATCCICEALPIYLPNYCRSPVHFRDWWSPTAAGMLSVAPLLTGGLLSACTHFVLLEKRPMSVFFYEFKEGVQAKSSSQRMPAHRKMQGFQLNTISLLWSAAPSAPNQQVFQY